MPKLYAIKSYHPTMKNGVEYQQIQDKQYIVLKNKLNDSLSSFQILNLIFSRYLE